MTLHWYSVKSSYSWWINWFESHVSTRCALCIHWHLGYGLHFGQMSFGRRTNRSNLLIQSIGTSIYRLLSLLYKKTRTEWMSEYALMGNRWENHAWWRNYFWLATEAYFHTKVHRWPGVFSIHQFLTVTFNWRDTDTAYAPIRCWLAVRLIPS